MTGETGSRVREAETARGPLAPPTAHVAAAAKIQPLDVTGVRTVAVGVAIWVVAFVALLPFYDSLENSRRGWWLWTCLAGVALGLLGLEYCRRRQRRLAARPAQEVETSPLGAAGL